MRGVHVEVLLLLALCLLRGTLKNLSLSLFESLDVGFQLCAYRIRVRICGSSGVSFALGIYPSISDASTVLFELPRESSATT
jgi:hypothetical protein